MLLNTTLKLFKSLLKFLFKLMWTKRKPRKPSSVFPITAHAILL